MQPEIKKYLFDIMRCIENIEMFIDNSIDFDIFKKNIMLQHAIERNLEVIGEAMNNILKIYPEIKITDARRIVDTRNKLIHGYDGIQHSQVWDIVITHIAPLKLEVQTLLEN